MLNWHKRKIHLLLQKCVIHTEEENNFLPKKKHGLRPVGTLSQMLLILYRAHRGMMMMEVILMINRHHFLVPRVARLQKVWPELGQKHIWRPVKMSEQKICKNTIEGQSLASLSVAKNESFQVFRKILVYSKSKIVIPTL